jgi:hypothetical protein
MALGLYGLYLLLLWFNAYNPMMLAFLTSFTMYNESGVDVWVTPIGMREGSGRYGPLPRYRDSYPPAWPVKERSDLFLADRAELTITYDWDDINFRHVLVRNASGDISILDTDRTGSLHSCNPAQQDRYGLPRLSELAPAPQELAACTRGETVSYAIREY